MVEKEIEDLVSGQLSLSIVLFALTTMGNKGKSKEEIEAESLKLLDERKKGFFEALDKAGYVIVKKEPALDKFPSLV